MKLSSSSLGAVIALALSCPLANAENLQNWQLTTDGSRSFWTANTFELPNYNSQDDHTIDLLIDLDALPSSSILSSNFSDAVKQVTIGGTTVIPTAQSITSSPHFFEGITLSFDSSAFLDKRNGLTIALYDPSKDTTIQSNVNGVLSDLSVAASASGVYATFKFDVKNSQGDGVVVTHPALSFAPAPVPEPGTMQLALLGMLGIASLLRRKN